MDPLDWFGMASLNVRFFVVLGGVSNPGTLFLFLRIFDFEDLMCPITKKGRPEISSRPIVYRILLGRRND